MQQRLPDRFNTHVLDEQLDATFEAEGRKMAHAMPPRRLRRFIGMLEEFQLRGGSSVLAEYYKRGFFEALVDEARKAPRGNTHGRTKHSPADGRKQ